AHSASAPARTPSWRSGSSCSCVLSTAWSPIRSSNSGTTSWRGSAPWRTTTPAARLELDPEDREHIHALVADLPRVWHDPRTPARERKRMLRLLIEDVTLLRAQTIQLHIRWKGGATTSIEGPLPRGAPEL